MSEFEPLTNQTQFAQEEPLFEPVATTVEEGVSELNAKKPIYKSKKLIIFIVFAFLFIFLLLLIAASGKKQEPVAVEENEIPEEVLEIISPLEEKLLLMQRSLEEADPTKQTLPFPPVDMEIRIDEAD